MWMRRLWLRLQSLFHRDRSAQQLDDEIQFHLEQQIAENIAAGMSAKEAGHAALRAFGNTSVLKEQTRDTWGWIWPGTSRPGPEPWRASAAQESRLHGCCGPHIDAGHWRNAKEEARAGLLVANEEKSKLRRGFT